MIPVVDGHHHIWRQADLPWLVGPMQPRIFGPYEPIRRDYPISEYRADLEGSGVVKSVYVQTNWPPERYEDEAAWVQRTADATGWPHAIVAYADMTADDVRPQLDRLSRYPLVRGARMQLHWHENPQYRFAARRDLVADPAIRRNVGRLADYGLSFDLQVFAPQMADAADLAEFVPEGRRSCCSTPACSRISRPQDARNGAPAWCAFRLAETSIAKLSGLGTFLHRNDPAHVAGIVRETVGIFGPGRCLFGSNFPIEKLWTSYAALIEAYRDAVAALPAKEQQAVLHDTAMSVYRIAP